MTLLTAQLENPTGYGRIVRKKAGSDEVKAIVEQKNLTPAQQKIREINSGFYAFDAKPLFSHIDKLDTDNHHGEFYLTDMAAILGKAKQRVVAVRPATPTKFSAATPAPSCPRSTSTCAWPSAAS